MSPCLCNFHLLRDLVFVEESTSEQNVWITPLSKLILKIKDAVTQAKTDVVVKLSAQMNNDFLHRYDLLVKKAARLYPPPPKSTVEGDIPKKKLLRRRDP